MALLGWCTLGCAPRTDGGPEPSATALAPTPPSDTYNLESLKAIAQTHGLTDPPEVAVVRYVSRVEAARVIAECLTAAGFPATVGPDGDSYEVESTAEQNTALGLADYTCTAQYPVDPAETQPYTQSQREVIADYLLEELVSCLADHGYPVDGVPPSRSTFLAQFTGDSAPWNPYLHLQREPTAAADYDALELACPANTPIDRLYGS